MSKPIIVGAGLSGLIAACKFPQASVFEASSPEKPAGHQALLRFRNESVSRITGIPFKKVTVRKGIWDHNKERLITRDCPLDIANRYSLKVTGGLSGRSIFNLSPDERFIAPDDFQESISARLKREGRIFYGAKVCAGDIESWREEGRDVISTIPLPLMLKELGFKNESVPADTTKAKPILVSRYKLTISSDIYQTVYFPQSSLNVYRASITGGTLIVESVGCYDSGEVDWAMEFTASREIGEVLMAFGLNMNHINTKSVKCFIQRNGKIVDLQNDIRSSVLYSLTTKYGIFSLGRFACWRNILLDDVAVDLDKIEKLMKASEYHRHLQL